MAINGFSWRPGLREIQWSNAGALVRFEYANAVPKALPLRDGSGVVVVEPHQDVGPNNVVVVDADGRLRFRVPLPREGRSWFGDAYYINGELTAIELRGGTDFAHVIDERTGRTIRSYESR